MNILAVDTAGKTAGVALLQDGRLLYEVYLDGGLTHSETLLPLIDTCLKLCGLTCAGIDLFGVNAGPGSFTGLRIGLAAVKGLAFPRHTPQLSIRKKGKIVEVSPDFIHLCSHTELSAGCSIGDGRAIEIDGIISRLIHMNTDFKRAVPLRHTEHLSLPI